MLFLWCQSLCMASNFILLKENEVIEAETDALLFRAIGSIGNLNTFVSSENVKRELFSLWLVCSK